MSAAQWTDMEDFGLSARNPLRPDPCGFWRDLSLPLPLPEKQVIELCRIAARVKEGFDNGSGVVAIFTGSDAAGKLMAVEALTYETQRSLHRVYASEIGGRVGQLQRILSIARAENAIVMFDNAEYLPDALLRSLNAYPGLSILAMDSGETVSTGFCEPSCHIVDFPFPADSE